MVWVLVLVLAVITAVGSVTAFAVQRSLTTQLDADLVDTANVVVDGAPADQPGQDPGPERGPPGLRPPGGGLSFLAVQFDAEGNDLDQAGSALSEQNVALDLTDSQLNALYAAAKADQPQTIDLGQELGKYRILSRSTDEITDIVGLSYAGVERTTQQLILTLVLVGLLALFAAAFGVAYLVRRSLAPLGRVASTASDVSRQELHLGEVAMARRVTESDTDPATEVGQVGLALNNLLDTMEGALQYRYESEQRVRQFVADASHELRTPLASIRGYAELSRRTDAQVPAEVAHAMGRVESESLRMQGLVEDLLLLARLDAGRPLERATVDLSMMTIDTVSDARVAGRQHQWVLELPEDPVEVIGDSARLHQVLVNLLANARVHTPEGTKITTSLRPGAEPASIEIVVADNGPGIPEDILPRMFERFARGDGSRSRQAGSTGLGLSIVDAVVKAHRGTVRAQSDSRGTTFTVTLPVV